MSRRRTAIVPWILWVLVASGCSAGSPPTHVVDENALGPYSGAVRAGPFTFVSGKIGKRGESFAEEVETAISAVESELRRVQLALSDVVSTTVYLTDMDDYPALNAIYARRFGVPYPARTCVAVRALPRNARVEIQVIAWQGK